MRKQHNVTVGKLKRIMVRAGVVRVHLPETCDPVRQRLAPSEQKLKSSEMALDLVLEGDLGAGKQADGHSRLVHSGEAPRGCIPEVRGD
jgi:hypothetical protein